ncbi:hypothetical protein D3H65_05985 [Paraflavitalea soli]|uniref:Uncharacterized protein n=1 Tax=Paraflavitalea soli TaxID=2315862 RepID=A0A3B7MPR2_9BACT|nr:hypothetical protein [Paraflavitalea soli]AXY73555.1 hypothetical protein D3H65_05985 [Paraflavitalea soli]
MNPHLALSLILIVLLSCKEQQAPQALAANAADTVKAVAVIDSTAPLVEDTAHPADPVERTEFFADSLHIGKRGLNKIELSLYSSADTSYAVIQFFSKQSNKWVLKNEYQYERRAAISCDPKLSDFNNDGLKDFTYISMEAARGANEVRRLFIYDKARDMLISMQNAEDYPNMQYNKELNCIDAFLVYGGCSTMFLRIKGDSLKPFARVELVDGLTVSTYDKQGKEKIIFQDSTEKAVYVRYKNYKPLKVY